MMNMLTPPRHVTIKECEEQRENLEMMYWLVRPNEHGFQTFRSQSKPSVGDSSNEGQTCEIPVVFCGFVGYNIKA